MTSYQADWGNTDMSKIAASEADDATGKQGAPAPFIATLLVISIVLSVLFILGILGSVFISLGAVGWWPLVKSWAANPAVKWVIALSFLSFGVVLFHIKSNHPRIFMFLEIVFAITLAWVALGESDASRLTVGLAIAATAFATADIFRGLQPDRGADSLEPRFGFDLNNIRVYQRVKLVCTIPKGIGGAAYKIELKTLEQRRILGSV
jgi:hypothetical protein